MTSLTEAIHKLAPESEQRLEVGDNPQEIQLISGDAECFGTELAKQAEKSYIVSNCRISLFTWEGCELRLNGEVKLVYVGNETPVPLYANFQSQQETMRATALSENREGPRVMVVGGPSTGKTALVTRLLSWASRSEWTPLHIDLCLENNSITLPGCIAATPVQHPVGLLDLVGDTRVQQPLVYFIGHPHMHDNQQQFSRAVTAFAENVQLYMQNGSERVRASGMIVDTPSELSQRPTDVESLAQLFGIDIVVVVDNERLVAQLSGEKKAFSVVRVPKSGGVIELTSEERATQIDTQYKKYFMGTPSHPLYPKIIFYKAATLSIFNTVPETFVPASAQPLGMNAPTTLERLYAVQVESLQPNSIIAVTAARSSDEAGIAQTLGFVLIIDKNTEDKSIQIMIPNSGWVPGNSRWLVGKNQWFDDSKFQNIK